MEKPVEVLSDPIELPPGFRIPTVAKFSREMAEANAVRTGVGIAPVAVTRRVRRKREPGGFV